MMKKILVMAFAAMLLVLVGASAQASLWVPTPSGDLDVNYVAFTGDGTFAIFDDSSSLGDTTDSYLSLVSTGDTIFFAPSGSDWVLTSDKSHLTFTLSGSNTFQLAWQPQGETTWYADTGYASSSYGVYNVYWTNVGSSEQSSSLIQIDAVPSAVPVPPSVVMLFSGLLGLVGVRRMRKDS